MVLDWRYKKGVDGGVYKVYGYIRTNGRNDHSWLSPSSFLQFSSMLYVKGLLA